MKETTSNEKRVGCLKRRVVKIPYQKGTAKWLQKFLSIIWLNPCTTELWELGITNEQFLKLRFIQKEFMIGKKNWCSFSDVSFYDFSAKTDLSYLRKCLMGKEFLL